MTSLRITYPLPVRELVEDPESGAARNELVPPDPVLFDEFAGVRLDMDDADVADLVTSGRDAEVLRVEAGLHGGAFVARHDPRGTLECVVEFTLARPLTQDEQGLLLQALAGYVDHAIGDGLGFALELETGQVFLLEPDTASPRVEVA